MNTAETVSEGRERLLGRLAAAAAERGLRIGYDLLGNRDEAEDAVQEALARACEACDRVRDPRALEGWFYRILTNVCLRTLRRRRLRHLVFGRISLTAEVTSAVDARADRTIDHQRDVAILMDALDELPTKQRAALLLRYGHELSVKEVADMLGVKPATAKTHLIRGLRRLRKTMERQS